MARADHQRLAARAAGVYCAAGERADAAPIADGRGVPLAADDAADGAGAVVAVAAASGAGRSAEDRAERRRRRSHALALQLLNRYGVLLREKVAAENVPGGFQRGV